MGKDKAGGTGMEDQPGGREKGQSWPSRAKPAARGRTRRRRGDVPGSHLGINGAEGEPVCRKAVLAGPHLLKVCLPP